MKIIGNKNEFAIEYQITDTERMLGYRKLWVQNSFYGTSKDLIFLKGYLINLLDDILNAKPYEIDFENINKEEIFEQLQKELNYTSKYLISSSTFTDDFLGFKFKSKNEIILVWKLLTENNLIFDDLKDYTKSVILVRFKYDTANKIINQFKEEIK